MNTNDREIIMEIHAKWGKKSASLCSRLEPSEKKFLHKQVLLITTDIHCGGVVKCCGRISNYVRGNLMKWLLFKYFCHKNKNKNRRQLHYITTMNRVVTSIDSGAKLPKLKPWLHCLLAVWPAVRYITSVSSSIK